VKAIKQVAGSLKADLAQYREMAAFAQFGSDLDAVTQRMLHRGARFTEMLKQNQYEPLSMEKEVVVMLAAQAGYLDDLEIPQIRAFEKGLYAFFDSKYAGLLTEIAEKKELSDDLRTRVIKALDEYKQQFLAEQRTQDGRSAA